MNTGRRGWFAVMAAVLVLGGCSSNGKDQGSAPGASSAKRLEPVKVAEADWKAVADGLGRPGKLMSGDTVYRATFPRRDLSVTSKAVQIKPGLALGSYAAFARYSDGMTMVMGDLVVTEDELPRVTDALQASGLAQTALHKHLLAQDPAVWWTHFEGDGPDAVKFATAVRAALDAPATPPPAPAPSPGQIDLDTAAIDAALGTKGTDGSRIYKFSFARTETVTIGGRVLPPAMGVATTLNFQPTGGGRAAINGDFAMTAPEVQAVIKPRWSAGIDIVELHQHALDDQPRLLYMHFWANDDAVKLAKGLRMAVDAQSVKPAA